MEEQKQYTDRFLRTEKIEKYKKKSKLLFRTMPYLSAYLCESLDFFKVGILINMNFTHYDLGNLGKGRIVEIYKEMQQMFS